jgi:hypothetical protein
MADMAAARRDVTFLFVNQGERRPVIESYLSGQKLMLPNVFLDQSQEVARHYATPGLPMTLFIGSDGKLRSLNRKTHRAYNRVREGNAHVGEISREALAAAVTRLVTKSPSPRLALDQPIQTRPGANQD